MATVTFWHYNFHEYDCNGLIALCSQQSVKEILLVIHFEHRNPFKNVRVEIMEITERWLHVTSFERMLHKSPCHSHS